MATIQATDGRQIFPVVFGPLPSEGPRIGILGDSGCGKTELMRRLMREYLRRMPKAVALVIDDKEAEPQFEGQQRIDRNDLAVNPASREPRIVVFRGQPFALAEGEVDPDEIANIQRGYAIRKRPSLVVYDELDKAANGGQWKNGDASAVRWAFIKGRNLGAASLWGTQETQAVPREAFNQSSSICAFRMIGTPLRLLKERGYLNSADGTDVGDVIAALPGDELPRHERGYFVLLRRGRPWDGKVYRFVGVQ